MAQNKYINTDPKTGIASRWVFINMFVAVGSNDDFKETSKNKMLMDYSKMFWWRVQHNVVSWINFSNPQNYSTTSKHKQSLTHNKRVTRAGIPFKLYLTFYFSSY